MGIDLLKGCVIFNAPYLAGCLSPDMGLLRCEDNDKTGQVPHVHSLTVSSRPQIFGFVAQDRDD
jgi:hypothetical protein